MVAAVSSPYEHWELLRKRLRELGYRVERHPRGAHYGVYNKNDVRVATLPCTSTAPGTYAATVSRLRNTGVLPPRRNGQRL